MSDISWMTYTRIIVLILCLTGLNGVVDAQYQNKQGVEEELVRYMGYEEIPTRYLSLPYDLSMNHNVERSYVDIGYVLICILPLLWLWRVKRLAYRWIMGLGMLVMWLMSVSSSIMIDDQYVKVSHQDGSLASYIEGSPTWSLKLLIAQVYDSVGELLSPVRSELAAWTAQGDQFTYVLMVSILALLFMIYNRIQRRPLKHYYIGLFLMGYALYMWFFSGGVVWYLYLLLPLLYIDALSYSDRYKKYGYFVLAIGLSYSALSYALKQTNLYFIHDEPLALVPSAILEYQLRHSSEQRLYDSYFPNISKALEKINADHDALVLQAGTSMKFLVDRNHQRVIQDPVLNSIDRIIQKYKYRSAVTQALRFGGVRYIIVSPNLPGIDQTPERTLVQKFSLLVNYLDDNPEVRLLATDRVVKKVISDGREVNIYSFFGEEVVAPGQYAIFELLDS